MNSKVLFNKIKYNKYMGDAVEVSSICTDTRKITPGCCFVAIKGFATDSNKFYREAIEKGASLVVFDDRDCFMSAYIENQKKIAGGNLAIVLTENNRTALAEISDAFYGHPTGKINLIGVTGTKGKTTTSIMIKSIFDEKGDKTGLVGTMYNMVGDKKIDTERTTPEANVLQPLFREMVEAGVKTCIMECSSQGLKLDRTGKCDFDMGIFTNLSPDHIGATEHPDMADYAASKAKLFKMCKKGLLNIDSPYFSALSEGATCELFTFGIDNETADFRAIDIKFCGNATEYTLEISDKIANIVDKNIYNKIKIKTRIPGKFSVYNSLSAAATAILYGIEPGIIQKALENVVVKGKAEIVPTDKPYTILIDYAHNPDSFVNIISAVRPFAKRVIFLFGAGGDRNRPRALMGKTAAENADFTIITSDNPRTEDPAKIVDDIAKGAEETGKPYVKIVDRREAIKFAMKTAQPGDVVVLAGKGHETTQILKDKAIPFDEREIVKELLAEV